MGAAVLLGAVVRPVTGFGIRIDAHEEECFFDNIAVGTKVGVSFQVAEGGFLDIDVMVSMPSQCIHPTVVFSGTHIKCVMSLVFMMSMW